MLKSKDEVALEDLGAGSAVDRTLKRKVSSIARHSISSHKSCRLISRVARSRKPKSILELGTSLGISTLYLAHARPESKIYTLEGDPNLARLAKDNFEKNKASNIEVIPGDIDETLPGLLPTLSQVDLAFVDANHTQASTLAYFYALLKKVNEDSIIILDDIHWSRGMKLAWHEISKHPEVTCSLDLYQVGIIFFKSTLQKQHWVLHF